MGKTRQGPKSVLEDKQRIDTSQKSQTKKRRARGGGGVGGVLWRVKRARSKKFTRGGRGKIEQGRERRADP